MRTQPEYFNSKYYDKETDTLKEDAPENFKKEYEDYHTEIENKDSIIFR